MTEIQEMGRELRELFTLIREKFHSEELNSHEGNGKILWDKMVELAIALHNRVKPTHSSQMIQNRGCDPDNPEFYNHLHSVEDLLNIVGC